MALRVLVVHNYYQQPGGEDVVVRLETELLQRHGHEVIRYERDNDELHDLSRTRSLLDTLWSQRTYQELATLIEHHRPDIVHCHNTFPLVSPSVYWAARRSAVPVVQTLHNFRLMCPNANFLRDGKPCEDCSGRWPLPGIRHACYRRSRSQTAAVASMLVLHRNLGTYRNKITRYIALNKFCRQKFIEGGLPADRIVIKPNFVESRLAPQRARSGFLFVGRLSAEKGVDVVARAMTSIPDAKIRIVGDGPEASHLKDLPGIAPLGRQPEHFVRNEMAGAVALIIPSIWYEALPVVALEAYAAGLPLIASRIGGLAELVEEGRTGLLFNPGQADDLAGKIRWAHTHPEAMAKMGQNARMKYEAQFTPERNYGQLIAIYEEAITETSVA